MELGGGLMRHIPGFWIGPEGPSQKGMGRLRHHLPGRFDLRFVGGSIENPHRRTEPLVRSALWMFPENLLAASL